MADILNTISVQNIPTIHLVGEPTFVVPVGKTACRGIPFTVNFFVPPEINKTAVRALPPYDGSLSTALKNTRLRFLTGGNAAWFPQTVEFYSDGVALQSGGITHDQSSWISTTVTGPAELGFTWKVSSEANYDFLQFYLDNVLQKQISGLTAWAPEEYLLTETKEYELKWVYIKDVSDTAGQDCGLLDSVSVLYEGEGIKVVQSLTLTIDLVGDFLRIPQWSVNSLGGEAYPHLLDAGMGVSLLSKLIMEAGAVQRLYNVISLALSRGDDLSLYQSLRSSLPGDIQKRIVLINAFTEALIVLQKQRNDLSGDAVKQAIAYLQTLANVGSASVSQKLSISIEDPASLFKSVPAGIYIDGRPI